MMSVNDGQRITERVAILQDLNDTIPDIKQLQSGRESNIKSQICIDSRIQVRCVNQIK